MIGKLIYDGLNMEYGLVLKVRDNLIETSLDRKYSLNEINSYKLRPATKEEALNLVYEPKQKILDESDRLKILFLNDEAECLVKNEQEFNLIYNFLGESCGTILKQLNMGGLICEYPALIFTKTTHGNIYEWNKLKNRDKNKPLIKFNGEEFREVFE